MCHKCGLNSIRFIFDHNGKKIDIVMSAIKTKNVLLSDHYDDYKTNTISPKWICYGCYNCGVVLV